MEVLQRKTGMPYSGLAVVLFKKVVFQHRR